MKSFKFIKILILLAGFLALSACATTNNQTDVDPDQIPDSGKLMASSELTHDWGDINIQSGDVTHRFAFTNDSDESLHLKGAQTSCMCTGAIYHLPDGSTSPTFGMHNNDGEWSAEIKPNELFEVEAIFDPLAHGPDGVGLIQRSVVLLTSDPDQPSLGLKVGGDVLYEKDFNAKN